MASGSKKSAVIDIGSNSVRFMISRPGGGLNDKRLVSTILAEGLALTGRLSAAAIDRTAQAVAGFVTAARQEQCDKIYLFATEAVRAASNGDEFTARVRRDTGLTVDVLQGALEAKIGYLGSCADLSSPAAVIDVGGASAEIICGAQGKIHYEKSLPLGMVRLIDLLGSDRKKIRAYAHEQVRAYGTVPHVDTVVGIGGSATAIGAMATNAVHYDAAKVHGTVVTHSRLAELEQAIFTATDVRERFPVLTENRARIIGHGVILFSEILTHLNAPSFTVSEKDNMEGYLIYKHRG